MLLDILFLKKPFCDVLKFKGVPQQKQYKHILWKPPTSYLSFYMSICLSIHLFVLSFYLFIF